MAVRGPGTSHHERRAEIVEAFRRLVAARGVDTVSLRDVAGEAGVSLGRVQHYFRTKDELLRATFDLITQRSAERVRARLHAAGDDADPRAVLRALAAEMLPADDDGRTELRVATAFTTRALFQPDLAENLRRGYAELAGLIELLLRTARDVGDPGGDQDLAATAVGLFGLVDGLSGQVLLGHLDPDTALAAVDAHLDRVLPRDPASGSHAG